MLTPLVSLSAGTNLCVNGLPGRCQGTGYKSGSFCSRAGLLTGCDAKFVKTRRINEWMCSGRLACSLFHSEPESVSETHLWSAQLSFVAL